MKTIAVTGGSGKLGSALIKELQQEGYNVTSLDTQRSNELRCRQIKVDLNDFGQVVSALHGAVAVIHLAAIPAPLGYPYPYIFSNNVVSGYNILEAASLLNIRKVVVGSSESSYGFAWAPSPFSPDYLPVDEEHPQQPQECYGLSKIVNELTAAMFDRRNGMQVISLRFSMITKPEDYKHLAISKPEAFKNIFWSYIDIRDAVSACIASLQVDDRGAVCLNITSSDTLSDRPTAELIEQFYPDVKDLRDPFPERTAIVSNKEAERVLGWKPRHSWADQAAE
ncbi:NAD-dependent epimerase/dehydratase family protein [Paenibacillus glycanilyticus]|uniref:Nucleoside-diphosphate-sugar epimerase n=1 Tax=Paenibacillus glycanilyticus TaxID=126569 RepID=A0ABQ6GDS3_9BACL|nr:NAD(P)-dependent oxidoreductase [Paenibacillus glycanilyticus]GLX67731.1 nucleoside-diphosphate-sugar epimerase [Paenibacillus glycanilyticus]